MAFSMDYLHNSFSGKDYMYDLLQKAEQWCDGNFDDVIYLYRNKPESYFREVKKDHMIMRTILKDKGGDPKSPINGRLKGVFFGVTLFRGGLPTISPFGDTRVHVPIKALLKKSCNLYFADFFCFGKKNHYVSLVLTKMGSKADKFCGENLPKLDPRNNKFLMMGPNASFKTLSQRDVIVEVFYTHDVDLINIKSHFGQEMVFFTKTKTHGKGHSTKGGLKKYTGCPVCNLCIDRDLYEYQNLHGYDVEEVDDWSDPWDPFGFEDEDLDESLIEHDYSYWEPDENEYDNDQDEYPEDHLYMDPDEVDDVYGDAYGYADGYGYQYPDEPEQDEGYYYPYSPYEVTSHDDDDYYDDYSYGHHPEDPYDDYGYSGKEQEEYDYYD